MAINHANQAEIIHLQPLGSKIASIKTYTLFKTDVMEVIRLVLPAGKQIAEHRAPGEVTILCLEGCVNLTSRAEPKELAAGDMLYLNAAEPHAVEAIEDSTVLVTIQLGNSVRHPRN